LLINFYDIFLLFQRWLLARLLFLTFIHLDVGLVPTILRLSVSCSCTYHSYCCPSGA